MQWLITGCSSGLGLELARTALQNGHGVIASSRNPSGTPQAVAEIQKLGGIWVTIDTAAEDVKDQVEAALAKSNGPVDVLVNNAGFADGGVLETFSIDKSQAIMKTNVFGPIQSIQAVLPSMRAHRTGVIVNISSSVFWQPHPAISVYAASKFAIEGLSEALAGELAPFNIRVLLVEPGAMRTNFVDPASREVPQIPEGYKGTMADMVLTSLVAMHGNQNIDPVKAAQAIVKEVSEPTHNPPFLRLPLGTESLEGMKLRAEGLRQIADAYTDVAKGVDFQS